MDWIDSNVAVGSLLDAEEVVTLLKKDVDLIIDARLCFTHSPIHADCRECDDSCESTSCSLKTRCKNPHSLCMGNRPNALSGDGLLRS